MSQDRVTHDDIARTAKAYRETVERAGGSITHEQSMERVRKAVNQGDNKRANNNR